MDQIEQICQVVRQQVRDLEIDPTQPIDEKALARNPGWSPSLVREALARLEGEALVIHQRGRWQVSPAATSATMREIFEVRTTLEGMCARLAADRITTEEIEGMKQLLKDFDRILREGDNTEVLAVDHKFHQRLYEASGNRFLARALEEMYSLIYRLSYFALDRMGSVRASVQEHHDIVSALQARDGRAAERTIQHHITHFQSMVEELL